MRVHRMSVVPVTKIGLLLSGCDMVIWDMSALKLNDTVAWER